MNAYRIALILCRAVAVALWWSAGFSVINGLRLFEGFWLSVAATFLTLFGSALAVAIIGGSSLEGEALSPKRALEKEELHLARAGAGLILLAFGVAQSLSISAALILGYFGLSPMQNFAGFVVPVLQCLVGFMLAFRLGLRRFVKTQ